MDYLRKQNQKLQNQIKSLEKQCRSQKRSIRHKQEKNKDMKEGMLKKEVSLYDSSMIEV